MAAQTIPASELRPGDVALMGWNRTDTVERVVWSDDRSWVYVYTDRYGDEAAYNLNPHDHVDVESRES